MRQGFKIFQMRGAFSRRGRKGLPLEHELLPVRAERTEAFDRYGSDDAVAPVILSVPHAGRDYPAPMLAQSRVPVSILRRLEDRYADLLIHGLILAGHDAIIARTPRALIDINRDAREIDPAMIRDLPHGQPTIASAKLRGGLGLFPRRIIGAGELWGAPLEWMEAKRRIVEVHQRYHTALAAMMARARDAHGFAILIDIHSMPPLPDPVTEPRARIVLGDRFGRSASSRLMTLASDICAGKGFVAARNHPYPGNYLLDRHGRPDQGFHAIQIEVDRSLYLDAAFDRPAAGVGAIAALLANLAEAFAKEFPRAGWSLAAE